jgi:hypothetical protein
VRLQHGETVAMLLDSLYGRVGERRGIESTEESIMGKSRRSRRRRTPLNTWSLAGPLSARSFLSILSLGSVGSILSFGSVLSIGSAGSILSIGSAGSILSIGSAGSILSIGSAGSILSIGGAGSGPRTDREEPEEGRSEQT